MRGYYSLVQFCPDPARAEVANVGVVLICPERHFIDCKFANSNDRPRRFFRVEGDELARLDEIKEALEARLRIDRDRLYKVEAFEQFIESRANKLLLTSPRNLRVEDPAEDLIRLFKELVGGRATGEPAQKRGQGISVRPRLREMFSRPELSERIKEGVEVFPKYGRPFKANYAFFNGKDSFVIPQTIHIDSDQTMREAELLALRGFQLAKHGLDGRQAELIIPLPSIDARVGATVQSVDALLKDSAVRTVFPDHLEELAEEVRMHAHVI